MANDKDYNWEFISLVQSYEYHTKMCAKFAAILKDYEDARANYVEQLEEEFATEFRAYMLEKHPTPPPSA